MIKGKLVIISAPSGAGKTTIVNHLLSVNRDLAFSISATTRKPRGNEKDGNEYYFLTIEDFKKKIEENDFVEWEEVYKDQYYGTLKSEVGRIWSEGKSVLFDVDAQGGHNLKNIFGQQAVSVFIMPPSISELEKRLNARGTDDPLKIRMRVGKAKEEIRLAGFFDHIVINDNLFEAQNKVTLIVDTFLKKTF